MSAVTLDDVLAAVEAVRRDMQGQIDEMKTAMATLLAREAAAPAHGPAGEDEVSPETVAILAATITAFLGKKVRIRSARLVQAPHESVSPWAQHGRVFVQAATYDLRHGR
jgi:hypothetical protein